MIYRIKVVWYYIEIVYAKTLHWFGICRDASVIPKGEYCYVPDEERNAKEKPKGGGYYIKPCKYYRHMRGELSAGCTYVGFIGVDLCLGDQCKICGENHGRDEDYN